MNGRAAALIVVLGARCLFAATPESQALVDQGNAAFRKGEREQAIAFFTEAARLDPSNHIAFWNRGRIRENEGRFAEAIPDFDIVVTLVTNHAGAFQLRGATWLRLGKPQKALADFDRYIELSPSQARHHWQRGIALYLLGRYEDAQKQYLSCHAANTNDVENALWHFAATGKLRSVTKTKLLPVGKDPRPIMPALYAFYEGKGDTNAIFTAAAVARPIEAERKAALTWAHFYLGLYYDATGKSAEARSQITKAAEVGPAADFIGALARSWPR